MTFGAGLFLFGFAVLWLWGCVADTSERVARWAVNIKG